MRFSRVGGNDGTLERVGSGDHGLSALRGRTAWSSIPQHGFEDSIAASDESCPSGAHRLLALLLCLLIVPLFSCGGPRSSGNSAGNASGLTTGSHAPAPPIDGGPRSTSPLDCISSQCISLPVVAQTNHRFAF